MPLLGAAHIARRVAHEVALGAAPRRIDCLQREVRQVIETHLGADCQVLSLGNDTKLRVVSSYGVIEFSQGLWLLREVPPGISAAEVQAHVRVPLMCAPDLAEVTLL
jgi:acyl CoA:acetate/3-ketoacid CoA transferase beta subunit